MSEKKYIEIEGTALALTPIFHGGDEKTGSTPVLRTILIYTEEYGEIPIPYLSGNSIRGKLRRLIMRDLFDLVGFETENPKVHHALFSGGMLESREETPASSTWLFGRQSGKPCPQCLYWGVLWEIK